MASVRTWGEMIKFSHSVFALPFALVGTVLALRHRAPAVPVVWLGLLILICMVSARSFAMTFNRIVDLEIDRRNPRTAGRPLPAGRLTMPAAVAFTIVCGAVFVAACAGFWWVDGNLWPLGLAVPVLGYLAGYSYCKRFTSLSHFALGAAIASAPPAAWLAIDPPSIGPAAAVLACAAALWIAGFDIIYACQDIDVDRRDGLHSLPARVGIARALWISRVCHLGTVGLLSALPLFEPLGGLYWAGVACVALLLTFEQALVRPNDLSRVNMAFFTVNGFVSLLFGAATLADVWTGP